ncbi:MAG: ABC transporter ATP-binding protein [Candidatus Methanomethylicia archaeon]
MAELNIVGVSKSFNNLKVLNNISFTAKPGMLIGVLGPSGCGKTTLLRILSGIEKVDTGKVLINNEAPNTYRHKIGYVPQSLTLYPWRTVEENIFFGLEIRGINKKSSRELVYNLLKAVGLYEFKDYYPHEISGGMKARACLARALAIDPDVLLMDEPFANIDAQTRYYLQLEVLKIHQKYRKTTVFVSHNVEEIVFLADTVIVLTKRPATVKKEIDLSAILPKPRSIFSDVFLDIRKNLIQLIQEEFT